MAVRVAHDGTILDPEGFSLAATGDDIGAPVAVGTDGTDFLVLARGPVSELVYVRVDGRTGAMLDPSPRALASRAAGDDAWFVDVAFDGVSYLVVWTDTRNTGVSGHDIYASRISRTGEKLDALDIPVTIASGVQRSPRVAFDGTQFVVVWRDWERREIYAGRVQRDGRALDPDGFLVGAAGTVGEEGLAAAADGARTLVIWDVARNAQRAWVGPDGTVTAASPAGTLGDRPWIRLVRDADGFVLAWARNNPLVLGRRATVSSDRFRPHRGRLSGIAYPPGPSTQEREQAP